MKKLEKFAINKTQLGEILGGRIVYKQDIDGDGRWDVKHVITNRGRYKIKIR